jgi:hypothetical protein
LKTVLASLALLGINLGLPTQDPRMAAEHSFHQGKWQESASAWRSVLAKTPGDSFAMMRLGACLHLLGQNLEAIEILEEARLPGDWLMPEALAWKAAAEVSEDLVEAAIESLTAAAQAGWWDGELLQGSRALRPLFKHPGVIDLREAAESRAKEAVDQFDPFLGRWRSSEGERSIERAARGMCIIDELDSGGSHLYGWHPGTCTWRLYRCEAGKITAWIGRFENGEGRFIDPEGQRLMRWRKEGEAAFVEEIFQLKGDREKLLLRRHHERLN